MRKGQGQSREVIQHALVLPTKVALQSRLRKAPVVIGHLHVIARDRVGNRNRRLLRRRQARALEVVFDGALECLELRTSQGL